MKTSAKKLTKPCKTASFKEYITYYMQRKGWSQATLASFARLNQSTVNKVITDQQAVAEGKESGRSIPLGFSEE